MLGCLKQVVAELMMMVMRKSGLFLFLVVLIIQPTGVRCSGPASSVYLRANPDSLIADGKSVATISAEIRDSSGNLVSDGTLVSFSSSLGAIQNTVSTAAGVARAQLTSGTGTGTATVSAWVTQGGVVAQTKVEMLALGTEISRQSFITISSDSYLVLDTSRLIVYGSGGVKIHHRGLAITADEAQLDVATGVLKCRRAVSGEPIKLGRGHKTMEANLIYYNLKEMKGNAIAEGASGKIERLTFRGADLTVQADEDDIPEKYFDFTDLSESRVLVKASSITVRPGKDIQIRRANVYMDGTKLLSVPLHVLPMSGGGLKNQQYLGWGTNGLKADVPLYYALSPNFTGALRVERGQQRGWGAYSGDSGWSLDLAQDYATNFGGIGSFSFNRLNSSDWGVHWNHSQEYDEGSRLYSYVDFPAHRDLFGTLNYTKPLSKASLGINLYGSKYRNTPASQSTDVYLQSLPKSIAGGAASCVLLARSSYNTHESGLPGGFGSGLQMQLYGRPVRLPGKTNLSTSFSLGHDWGGSGAGVTVLGNASLSHQFGRVGSAGLQYSYGRAPATSRFYGRQRLSANISYMPSAKLTAHVFSTYTLDKPFSSTFAEFDFTLSPLWRIGVLQNLQRDNQYDYSDTEVSLGRTIKDSELMLVWSKSRNKLRIEFNPVRF